ncbi:MAG: NADP-dependent oxidoreductase [Pirellulales bacterium]|nr:NADP-dependent oxidoreductase [Pirellulales bacterium]
MSNANINRQWRLKTRPKGMVSEANFEYREEPIPTPRNGQILVRNLYLSFDPAMRAWLWDRPSYIPPVGIGEVMRASAVAQVIESKKPGFEAGDFVVGAFGWQDYAATTGGGPVPVTKIPPGVPLTWPLGVLGMTGLTAYFGLLDITDPKAGETVVVSGAAGAVGSVVAQIARIKGCRVIGIAGGSDKCRWLVERARVDAAIDYKSEDVAGRLKELCPKGINVYFDNVGGETLEAVLNNLALHARISLCGGISQYNAEGRVPGPANYLSLLVQRARMEGFIVFDYLPRFGEAIAELAGWVMADEIRIEEDIQEGFENIPKTLLRLFEGKNLGKQLLKLADPPTKR